MCSRDNDSCGSDDDVANVLENSSAMLVQCPDGSDENDDLVRRSTDTRAHTLAADK